MLGIDISYRHEKLATSFSTFTGYNTVIACYATYKQIVIYMETGGLLKRRINRLRNLVHLQRLHPLRLPRVFDTDGSYSVHLKGPDPFGSLNTSFGVLENI